MKGAAACLAVDNDEWCVRNSMENLALNRVDGISVRLGDASALRGEGPFDYILANINRNILEDVSLLRQEAESLGWRFDHARDLNRWACVEFVKPE